MVTSWRFEKQKQRKANSPWSFDLMWDYIELCSSLCDLFILHWKHTFLPIAPLGFLGGGGSKILCCCCGGSVEYSGMILMSPTSGPRSSTSRLIRLQASSISWKKIAIQFNCWRNEMTVLKLETGPIILVITVTTVISSNWLERVNCKHAEIT